MLICICLYKWLIGVAFSKVQCLKENSSKEIEQTSFSVLCDDNDDTALLFSQTQPQCLGRSQRVRAHLCLIPITIQIVGFHRYHLGKLYYQACRARPALHLMLFELLAQQKSHAMTTKSLNTSQKPFPKQKQKKTAPIFWRPEEKSQQPNFC